MTDGASVTVGCGGGGGRFACDVMSILCCVGVGGGLCGVEVSDGPKECCCCCCCNGVLEWLVEVTDTDGDAVL